MSDARDFIQFDDIDKNGPKTYSRIFELTAAELDRDEIAGTGPVAIEATAIKGDIPAEYLVDGSAKFTADLTCSRCTDPYPFASSSPFHLRFRPQSEAARDADEIEITPDELDIEFYAERAISLRELAIEQVQLSIPMKPLCDDNCLGLCPRCGGNRNRQSCQCEESPGDDRWGALRSIREELAKRRES